MSVSLVIPDVLPWIMIHARVSAHVDDVNDLFDSDIRHLSLKMPLSRSYIACASDSHRDGVDSLEQYPGGVCQVVAPRIAR